MKNLVDALYLYFFLKSHLLLTSTLAISTDGWLFALIYFILMKKLYRQRLNNNLFVFSNVFNYLNDRFLLYISNFITLFFIFIEIVSLMLIPILIFYGYKIVFLFLIIKLYGLNSLIEKSIIAGLNSDSLFLFNYSKKNWLYDLSKVVNPIDILIICLSFLTYMIKFTMDFSGISTIFALIISGFLIILILKQNLLIKIIPITFLIILLINFVFKDITVSTDTSSINFATKISDLKRVTNNWFDNLLPNNVWFAVLVIITIIFIVAFYRNYLFKTHRFVPDLKTRKILGNNHSINITFVDQIKLRNYFEEKNIYIAFLESGFLFSFISLLLTLFIHNDFILFVEIESIFLLFHTKETTKKFPSVFKYFMNEKERQLISVKFLSTVRRMGVKFIALIYCQLLESLILTICIFFQFVNQHSMSNVAYAIIVFSSTIIIPISSKNSALINLSEHIHNIQEPKDAKPESLYIIITSWMIAIKILMKNNLSLSLDEIYLIMNMIFSIVCIFRFIFYLNMKGAQK